MSGLPCWPSAFPLPQNLGPPGRRWQALTEEVHHCRLLSVPAVVEPEDEKASGVHLPQEDGVVASICDSGSRAGGGRRGSPRGQNRPLGPCCPPVSFHSLGQLRACEPLGPRKGQDCVQAPCPSQTPTAGGGALGGAEASRGHSCKGASRQVSCWPHAAGTPRGSPLAAWVTLTVHASSQRVLKVLFCFLCRHYNREPRALYSGARFLRTPEPEDVATAPLGGTRWGLAVLDVGHVYPSTASPSPALCHCVTLSPVSRLNGLELTGDRAQGSPGPWTHLETSSRTYLR